MAIRSIYPNDAQAKGRGAMEIKADSSTPAKRRRRWPWIAGGVVAIVIVTAGVIGANTDKSANNGAATSVPPPPAQPSATAATSVSAPSSSSSTVPPSSQAVPPADPVETLRTAFLAGYAKEVWFTKVTAVDLDGRAVIGRSTMADGDHGALAACEALRNSATKAAVDFQSVAIRDVRDRTLAHWSGLTGDAGCAS